MKHFIACVGMLVMTGIAFAAEQDSRDCSPFGNAAQVIAACSRLIDASRGESSSTESFHKLAEVYANRGFAYFRNGNVDQAMNDYNEALHRNSQLAMIYNYRGLWYVVKHDNNRAIAEFSKGIKLDSKDAQLRMGRGGAYSLSGKVKLAIDDYDAALRIDPRFHVPLIARGVVYYFNNAPDKARADFASAAAIAPKDPMPALWLDIVDRHAGKKSQLSTAVQRFDMNRWPAPLVQVALGEYPPEWLLAPEQPDLAKNPSLLCDHTFYSAEYTSLQGTKQEADRLFKQALEACPPYYLEGIAVNALMRAQRRTH